MNQHLVRRGRAVGGRRRAALVGALLAMGVAACSAGPSEPCATCVTEVDAARAGDPPAGREASTPEASSPSRSEASAPAERVEAGRPAQPDASTVQDASPSRPEASVEAAVPPPPVTDPIGGLRMPITATHQATSAHDPALIQSNGVYYLFATGGNLSIRTSTNLIDWRAGGNVLAGTPAWVAAAVPGTNGMWAPDVSFFAGKFHVYYAASTFGSNRSAIGLSTNVTLDASSPDYKWVDEGLIVQSTSADNFNAIDPNVALDADGQPWLSFGSFWDGIKMRKLDPATGKVSTTDTTLYALASRGGGAIEAPSIVYANGWYYLFVSYDLCCKTTMSTYRTMAGRSRSITGPYVDTTGKLMSAGNAVQLLATDGRYIGPGGGTVIRDNNQLLYVHHYYDGMSNGRATLQIHPLALDASEWLVVGDPLWP